MIRISIDTKANVNIGPFSRGGYSRQAVKACDHDFHPDTVLKPFGIFLPAFDETYFYFTSGTVTADFMVDALEDLWPSIKARFNPHTIAINADNGPENNSRRTQFMKRLLDFAIQKQVSISLIYYPSYRQSQVVRIGKYTFPPVVDLKFGLAFRTDSFTRIRIRNRIETEGAFHRGLFCFNSKTFFPDGANDYNVL